MKRIKDPELLRLYQGRECLICKRRESTVGHHIKSKGSGGHDVLSNLIPVCYEHHEEVHRVGLKEFAKKYSVVLAWIQFWGWTYEPTLEKWLPPKEENS